MRLDQLGREPTADREFSTELYGAAVGVVAPAEHPCGDGFGGMEVQGTLEPVEPTRHKLVANTLVDEREDEITSGFATR